MKVGKRDHERKERKIKERERETEKVKRERELMFTLVQKEMGVKYL